MNLTRLPRDSGKIALVLLVAFALGGMCLPALAAPSFRTSSALPVPADPTEWSYGVTGLASGDFNGDGLLDLAFTLHDNAYRWGEVGILLGNGDGTFQAPVRLSIKPDNPAVGWAHAQGLAAADLDGDGRLDVIAASAELRQILFFRGRGDGTLAAPVRTASNGRPIQVRAADLDGDGILDVATSNHDDGSVSIFRGKGDGTFAAPVDLQSGQGPTDVSLADVNGDGALDLVVSHDTGQGLAVFLNDGHGGFPSQPVWTGSGRAWMNGLFVADFDGDGRLDLVVAADNANKPAGSPSVLALLKGLPGGRFDAPEWILVARGWLDLDALAGPADFDGDGIPDLAQLRGDGVDLLSGKGDGTFRDPEKRGSFCAVGRVRMADFDGDGRPDLAFIGCEHYRSLLAVAFGEPGGTFTYKVVGDFGSGGDETRVWNLATADFNGDGRPDLACWARQRDGSESLEVFLSSAAAPRTFLHAAGTPDLLTGANGGAALAAGDFDGDRKADLLFTRKGSPNQIMLFRGNGDGTFAPATIAASDTGTYRDFASGDLNGDGLPDLVAAGDGPPQVFLNAGGGTFHAPVAYSSGSMPFPLRLADLAGSYGHKWTDSGWSNFGGTPTRMNPAGPYWSLGIYLKFAFFDGMKAKGQVMQARSDQTTAEIELAKLRDQVSLQTRTSVDAVKENAEIVRALSGTVEQAERVLVMANKGFEYGVKTRLDVDDAQQGLNQSRGNLARAKRDYLVAQVNLLYAQGVLGEKEPESRKAGEPGK